MYRKYIYLSVIVATTIFLGYYFLFFLPQKNANLAERQKQEQVIAETEKQESPEIEQVQDEQKRPEREETDAPIEELILTGEDLKSYYAVYKDPFVIHIRKALNGYLAGTNAGIDAPDVTIEKGSFDDGTPTGLAAFDRSYYSSKFVVMNVDTALFGGREISLIFQDRPDRIFTAWVYKYGDEDRYDLRGFWEQKEATKHLESELKRFGKYIFDKEHSL